jgi:O-antigen ligase
VPDTAIDNSLGSPLADSRSRLGTLAAGAFGIGLGLPITPMELAGIPLMVFTLVALFSRWRSLADLARQPFAIALIAWIVWAVIALAWSPDRAHGLDELANARWLWTLPVLMHASQAAQLVLQAMDNPWIAEHRLPDRVSGWSRPAVAGSLLCSILGLHLPRAMFAADWTRRVLAVLALVGLIATGTRGAWIVAAVMLAAAILVLIALGIRHKHHRARAIVVALAGVVVITSAGVALRDNIESRVSEAQREITAALEDGNKHTSTGGRIAMIEWALEAVRAEPITGVGTGGYRAWVNEQQAERGIDPDSQRVLDHAHNAYLHIAATQGLVGLVLYAAVVALALRNAWPRTPEAAGLFTAIVGLALVSMFDTIPVNAQTSALAMTLAAAALVSRQNRDQNQTRAAAAQPASAPEAPPA